MKKTLLFLFAVSISAISFAQLSISASETDYTIDFDNTVTDVNNGSFSGSGYALTPAAGQLNSNAFSLIGMSAGDLDFGAEGIDSDYARGSSINSTSGGCYGFDVSVAQDGSNMIWGVQPTSSDFTPGSVILKVVNNSGAELNTFNLSYLAYVYNHGGRSVSFNFSFSTDNNNYINVNEIDFVTPEALDADPAWESNNKSTTINTSITNGGTLYLKWTCSEVSGSGSRDKVGLDNIVINGSLSSISTVAVPEFSIESGLYTEVQNVELSSETDGASIYYTLDGSEPTDASTLYSSPIAVSSTTTIKAKGYKSGYNASGIVSATYTFPEEVANIAALRAKVGEGGTYKLTGEAIISFMQSSRNQKFVQDATGGITIDDASGVITSSYSQFDGITGLIGTLSVYNSLVQFIPAADPGAASSTGNSVTATEVTIPTLTANWEQYESTLIKVVNLTFADADGSATFANSNNYNVTDGSLNDFVIRTGFKDIDLIGEVIPTMASITGVAQRYNSTLQMFPRSLADVSSTPTNIPTAKAQAKFGPNPFTNELLIESASDIKEARLFNTAGQVVKNVPAANGRIATGDVPAGLYIIQVEFIDGTSTTQKLIKK